MQEEVHVLAKALDLPDVIECMQKQIKEDRVMALCMLLRCLAYPSRLVDIEFQFGWGPVEFHGITCLEAATIWHRWKYLLCFDSEHLTLDVLVHFAATFTCKGCPIDLIVAIINGTLKKIAHPSQNQHIVFNGWKRMHCLKYHLVVMPDGIIIHIFSPVEGWRHDATLLWQSGLLDILDKHFWGPNGKMYFIYGDPAYPTAGHIMAPL
ncbi:hypothetical protein MVEN_01692000 [Mycena venus]|uniref:DDE Tnp4 domain-containing protein n=1 Tax=Mycena venus TaxID=2733690 RepID=A0A8H6XLU6_9AGAR|nr:hypothetical protein MVEN_01692000 [Mycena venus]